MRIALALADNQILFRNPHPCGKAFKSQQMIAPRTQRKDNLQIGQTGQSSA
jgi:hypothetical protein